MSFYCFLFYAIGKKSNIADLYGPRDFFVEHIKLHLCIKFKLIGGCEGCGLSNFEFKSLISTPSGFEPLNKLGET